MEIKTSSDAISTKIDIHGVIRSIEDSEKLKEALNTLSTTTVEINVYDSFALPSTVIGILLKKANVDKTTLYHRVHNERLFSLLDNLNLVDALNASKITE